MKNGLIGLLNETKINSELRMELNFKKYLINKDQFENQLIRLREEIKKSNE